MSRWITRTAAFLSACTLVVAATACGGGDDKKTAEDVPPDAIALVGDTPIPRAEFDDLMTRAKENYDQQKRKFPKAGTPEYQDLKNRAVQYLVQRYEFREEADELGVEVSDADIDKKLGEIQKTNFGNSRDKLLAALKKEGLSEDDLREQLRDQILQEKLYEKITEDITVTEKEEQEYYDKNKQQFSQPATRSVRHILVKSKKTADEVYAKLRSGGDFAKLARQYSTDQATKKIGGKLPVTKGQTVPPFDKAAFELETGAISKPVKTQFGWHVIKADSDVKAEKVTPFDEVKKSIHDQLLQQKKDKAVRDWLAETDKKFKAETVYAVGFAPPKTDTATGATATTTG